MDLKETITVELEKGLVEEAVSEWLFNKGYTAKKIKFDIKYPAPGPSLFNVGKFEGVTAVVEKVRQPYER